MPGELHKISAFGGMAPAADPTLLPEQNAEYALNAWLDEGTLLGFPEPKVVYTSELPLLGYVYRIPNTYEVTDDFVESFYLSFANPDTSVIRGQVFGDIDDRYYWASSSGPPMYRNKVDLVDGHPPLLLGLNPPTIAPGVTSSGGAGPAVSRAYVYTWVSRFEEESAPSPATVINGHEGDTWNITLTLPPPDDLEGPDRDIHRVRIYRTITSASGIATFFLVADQDVDDVTYSDTLEDEEIVGSQQLQSETWTPPPADLQGLVVGPSGIVAGWRENEVWFSENYRPHAWPVQAVVVTEYPVVGMGVINQTFVVLTKGYPVTITGTDPLNMAIARLPVFEPCTSRGSIVSAPEGVYYASGNGLMLVQLGAVSNITKAVITKERWQTYTGTSRFRAGRLGSAYVGFGTTLIGVFQSDTFQSDAFQQEDHRGAQSGIYFDPTNQRISLVLLSSDIDVNNVLNDPWTTELFILKGGQVHWLDLSDALQPSQPAQWISKEFQTFRARSYGAFKVYFSVPLTTPPQNPERDTDQNQELVDGKYAVIRWYGDGRNLGTYELRKSGELLRLNSASKYDFIQFGIETNVEIKNVQFATTAKELAGA